MTIFNNVHTEKVGIAQLFSFFSLSPICLFLNGTFFVYANMCSLPYVYKLFSFHWCWIRFRLSKILIMWSRYVGRLPKIKKKMILIFPFDVVLSHILCHVYTSITNVVLEKLLAGNISGYFQIQGLSRDIIDKASKKTNEVWNKFKLLFRNFSYYRFFNSLILNSFYFDFLLLL